jgi:hypothetical protein
MDKNEDFEKAKKLAVLEKKVFYECLAFLAPKDIACSFDTFIMDISPLKKAEKEQLYKIHAKQLHALIFEIWIAKDSGYTSKTLRKVHPEIAALYLIGVNALNHSLDSSFSLLAGNLQSRDNLEFEEKGIFSRLMLEALIQTKLYRKCNCLDNPVQPSSVL